MNSYELSRAFCNWAFENPEKIKPIHYAIYFFTIEHCNRLGWKEKFGLPSQMVMEAIGVKNWRTYSDGLNELISFGFLTMIETSKNQYSSNIVAIVNFTKAHTEAHTEAHTKALDKALLKHGTKQSQSTDSIDKPLNNEQGNNKPLGDTKPKFQFKKSLLNLGVDENLVDDFLLVRKAKRAANTETVFNSLKTQIELAKISPNEAIRLTVERSWATFKADWYANAIGQPKQTAPQQGQFNYKNLNV